MNLTKEEKLELAKKCDASVSEQEGLDEYYFNVGTVVFDTQEDFFAYTSAIEEKYQAQIDDARRTAEYWKDEHLEGNKQIAMLRGALMQHKAAWKHSHTYAHLPDAQEDIAAAFESAHEYGNRALSATQATADAFIAEVKAGALEEAATWFDKEEYVTYTIKNGAISHEDYAEFQLRRMAAELRNQQEGKEGGK